MVCSLFLDGYSQPNALIKPVSKLETLIFVIVAMILAAKLTLVALRNGYDGYVSDGYSGIGATLDIL